MKMKFVCDLHIGSTNEKKVTYDLSDKKLMLIGDIFDMTNCKKSEVKKYQNLIDNTKAVLKERYLFGNHEAQRDYDRLYKIPGTRTGVMHGDYIFWGAEKSQNYREKSHGAGFLKRLLWVNALEAFENGYDRKIKTDDLDRFNTMCIKYDVDRVIVGHLHCKKRIDITYKGKLLTVLPRGMTELEI